MTSIFAVSDSTPLLLGLHASRAIHGRADQQAGRLWFEWTGSANQPFHGSEVQVPRGYCTRYHWGSHYSGCIYIYTCFKCTTGAHPAINRKGPRTAGSKGGPQSSGNNASHGTTPSALPTPVQPHRLAQLLEAYDPTITEYLLDGFINGFTGVLVELSLVYVRAIC